MKWKAVSFHCRITSVSVTTQRKELLTKSNTAYLQFVIREKSSFSVSVSHLLSYSLLSQFLLLSEGSPCRFHTHKNIYWRTFLSLKNSLLGATSHPWTNSRVTAATDCVTQRFQRAPATRPEPQKGREAPRTNRWAQKGPAAPLPAVGPPAAVLVGLRLLVDAVAGLEELRVEAVEPGHRRQPRGARPGGPADLHTGSGPRGAPAASGAVPGAAPRYGRTGATNAHNSHSAARARPALRRVNAPRERFRGGDLAHAQKRGGGAPPVSTRRSRHRPLPAWRPRSIALPWERGAGRREDGGRPLGAVALLLLGSVGSLPPHCSPRGFPHVFQSPCKIGGLEASLLFPTVLSVIIES